MSSTYTYTQLGDAIKKWTTETSSEFSSQIDNIIGLAELMILRDLPLKIFDAQDTVILQGGSNLAEKPTGLLDLIAMYYYDGSGALVFLRKRSREWLIDFGGLGDPQFIADESSGQWLLAPAPQADRTATVRYIARPAQLSSSVQSTWISQNLGDLLLFACLVSCEQFLKGDDRIAVWRSEYSVRLAAARVEFSRLLRESYP